MYTEQWKSRPIASFYLYGAIFLVFLVASPFYAWLIHFILDKYEETSKTRNSFSFGDLIVIITGIFIGLYYYHQISKETIKARRFHSVILSCDDYYEHIKMRITTPSTQRDVLALQLCDLLCMHFMLPIFFLWDTHQTKTHSLATLDELLGCIDNPGRLSENSLTVIFRSQIMRGTTASSILISHMEKRLLALESSGCFLKDTSTSSSSYTKDVRTKMADFKVTQTNMVLWIVSVANGIIAVLYLLLSPFLLWFSEGWMMLYTYPVIFLIVGGLVTFRWYIGDVILYPNTLFTKPSYDAVAALGIKTDSLCGILTRAMGNRCKEICIKFQITS